jgi:hypothetical protein
MVQCRFATTSKPSGQTAHYAADISSRVSQILRNARTSRSISASLCSGIGVRRSSPLHLADTKEATTAFIEKRPVHFGDYNAKRQQQRNSEEHARIVGLRRSEFPSKGALVQFPWRCSRLARRDHLVGIDVCSHRTRCERR